MRGGVKTDGFKGSGVVGFCMVGARFGESVVINGFKGVGVVTTVASCIMVSKLSSG